jgi:hypothetical protein
MDMSDRESSCSCNSKKESNNLPVLIGGVIIYELAVTIILLIFILWELEEPYCGEHCDPEPCGCKCKSNDIELSIEN